MFSNCFQPEKQTMKMNISFVHVMIMPAVNKQDSIINLVDVWGEVRSFEKSGDGCEGFIKWLQKFYFLACLLSSFSKPFLTLFLDPCHLMAFSQPFFILFFALILYPPLFFPSIPSPPQG
jgi:hypothetical protein